MSLGNPNETPCRDFLRSSFLHSTKRHVLRDICPSRRVKKFINKTQVLCDRDVTTNILLDVMTILLSNRNIIPQGFVRTYPASGHPSGIRHIPFKFRFDATRNIGRMIREKVQFEQHHTITVGVSCNSIRPVGYSHTADLFRVDRVRGLKVTFRRNDKCRRRNIKHRYPRRKFIQKLQVNDRYINLFTLKGT